MIVQPFFINKEIDKIMDRINNLENSKIKGSENEKTLLDKEIESLMKNLLLMSIKA